MAPWLGGIVAALIIFLFLPIAILQWLAGLLLVLTALSYGYVRLIEKHLEVQRMDQSPRTFRFADTPVKIRIKNPLPVPIPYLLISDECGGMMLLDSPVEVLSLGPGETTVLEYRVKSDRRGQFMIGPGSILFSDPLGLFRRQLTVSEPVLMLVLPRVYPLSLPALRGLPIGAIRVENRLYEDPSRYRSMREYVPGDDPRKIHWKVSARTGELHVMEYSSTLSSPAVIALNIDADAYTQGRRFQHFERCIEAAASLCNFWEGLDQEIALIINSREPVLFPKGKNQVPGMLEALSRLESADEMAVPMTELLADYRFSMGDRIFFVSPAISLENYRNIASMLPANSDFDFWLLQDRQKRDDHVFHGMLSPVSRHRILSLEEYGEDLVRNG